MRHFNVGCIGARTTAFKTVRYDEVTMQRYGVNTESFDLSQLIADVQNMDDNDKKVIAKKRMFENFSDFSNVP